MEPIKSLTVHGGKDLKKGTFVAIENQAGIDKDLFNHADPQR